LVPVQKNFCANLSVVGFIFLVQGGDLSLHLMTKLFSSSTARTDGTEDTIYVVVALVINLLLLGAYFTFFLLIYRSTRGARTFEDLVLHTEVPELVYLQTRKLLRDEHLRKAEERRLALQGTNEDEEEGTVTQSDVV